MDKQISFYHYYEKETGPFMSLSDLSDEEAQRIINDLIKEDKILAAITHGDQYMYYRRLIVTYSFTFIETEVKLDFSINVSFNMKNQTIIGSIGIYE